MITPTPESLGITPQHITETIRNPRSFSNTVMALSNDIEGARQRRDALLAGSALAAVMALTCAMDFETVLKEVEKPNELSLTV